MSSLTIRMLDLRAQRSASIAQDRATKAYLGLNGVSLDLGFRILTYVRSYRTAKLSRTSIQGVRALQDMPEQLRQDLSFEVYVPIVSQHPLLKQIAQSEIAVAKEISHRAMCEESLCKKGMLFTEGTTSPFMYIVISGELAYSRQAGGTRLCGLGSWISEAALWIDGWVHRGDAEASGRLDVVALDAKVFRGIFKECMWSLNPGFRTLAALVSKYAFQFVADEDCDDPEDAFQCSDLWGDTGYVAGLVSQVFNGAGVSVSPAAKWHAPAGWRSLAGTN